MGGLAESEILVSSEILKQRAQNIDALLKKAATEYQELEERVKETESFLKGKSADRLRKKIYRQQAQGDACLKDLCVFPGKLNSIAEEYALAEEENQNVADKAGN